MNLNETIDIKFIQGLERNVNEMPGCWGSWDGWPNRNIHPSISVGIGGVNDALAIFDMICVLLELFCVDDTSDKGN